MARFEIAGLEQVGGGSLGGMLGATAFFELGLMYSVGGEVEVDLVAAHKWFNISASYGSAEAARLRREIADQMSEQDIAAAQRAARDWLRAAH